MSTNFQNRLSSDSLYTYSSFENIKLILENGLRHSLNTEKYPYKEFEHKNFIVSFCDILPTQVEYHRSIYGKYGIALSKEWGIRNGVTPVRYIHENSRGAQEKYTKLKSDLRECRKSLQYGNPFHYFQLLVLHSSARKAGLLTKDNIEDEENNNELYEFINNFERTFAERTSQIGNDSFMQIYFEWIVPLISLIEIANDELEKRDSLLRIYKGNFRGIKSKVFYDEREWRSVKFISEANIIAEPEAHINALSNKYLPQKFNLKFETEDIVAILVENEMEKENLKLFISQTLTNLPGAEKLVFTFSEHLDEIYNEGST